MEDARYAELACRLWYEFGVHPHTGLVDIASMGDDILLGVHPAIAARILSDHNKSLTDEELERS